ncbi:MAG: M48 family metallopeptidase [Candidatus Micrarchaeia archaeon]
MKVNIYEFTEKNKRDSLILIFSFFIILILLAWVIGEVYAPDIAFAFVIFAFLFSIFDTLFSYYNGDKIVLKAVGARKANPQNPKEKILINVVEELSIAAGIKTPEVYVMPGMDINAFATGRDPEHSSVCVTEGALNLLNRSELSGVVGHEITHIRNYDVRLMTLIATLIGIIGIISYIFLRTFSYSSREERKGEGILILFAIIAAIFAPLVSRVAQAMLSRRREFLADMGSAQLTKNPEGLASALEKIKRMNTGRMEVSESLSHLFFTDPTKSPLDELFATHPPLDERIKVLRSL